MPRAKSEAPMSAYDYDQERLRDDCKSPDDQMKRAAANMKALRLLDQTNVKSPKEAERNYNSNTCALKLFDEVAGGASFKPQPAVPGMDLSPKQYTGHEDIIEDDVAPMDNFRKYKSSEAIAREKSANYKALKLIDAKFGGAANQKATKKSSPFSSGGIRGSKAVKAAAAAEKTSQEDIEEIEGAPEGNFGKYKSSEAIAREKSANYKALKMLDAKFGGAAKEKATKKSSPFSSGASGGSKSMKAAAAEKYTAEKQQKYQSQAMVRDAKKYQEETRPKMLVANKKWEKMATTTRKKKQLTSDDVRDPESVSGMKCELDHNREKLAENKALKLASSSRTSETGIV